MATIEFKSDPNIIAAELGKLFGLDLTADMIGGAGWEYESISGGRGVIKVELVKWVDQSAVNDMMRKARR